MWQFTEQLKRKTHSKPKTFFGKLFGRKNRFRTRRDHDLRAGKYPRGYEWDVFGRGPEPYSSGGVPIGIREGLEVEHENSVLQANKLDGYGFLHMRGGLSGAETKVLAGIAKQNVDLLSEDCQDWLELVKGCRGRPTGVHDMYDEFGYRVPFVKDV